MSRPNQEPKLHPLQIGDILFREEGFGLSTSQLFPMSLHPGHYGARQRWAIGEQPGVRKAKPKDKAKRRAKQRARRANR